MQYIFVFKKFVNRSACDKFDSSCRFSFLHSRVQFRVLHKILQAISSEAGYTAFYALVILPVAMAFTMIAVDLSAWNAERETAQQAADRIAMEAAKALPDVELAKQVVLRSVAQLPRLALAEDENGPNSIPVSSNKITVTLTGSRDSVFDFFTTNNSVLSISETATAQIVPTDFAVVISNNSKLRPPPYAAWGDAVSWPSAGYFDRVKLPCSATTSAFPEICAQDKEVDFNRWATQNCYNPAFSALKLGAINLSDFIASNSNNRLAVFFTPGDSQSQPYSRIRSLRFPESSAAVAEASWCSNTCETGKNCCYADTAHFINDELCIYLADNNISPGTSYQLPNWSTAYGFKKASAHFPPSKFPPGLPLVGPSALHLTNNLLSAEYRSQLTLAEAIYYRTTRASTSDSANQLIRTLNQALSELLSTCSGSSCSDFDTNPVASRGNIHANTSRRIIALVNEIPEADNSELEQFLVKLHQHNAQLTVVAFAHQGINASELEQSVIALNSRDNVQAFIARSELELRQIVSQRVTAMHREIVIRS